MLVGVADGSEDGRSRCAAGEHVLDIEVVEGVGGLEPGAAVVEVEAHGVGVGDFEIDAVKCIFFVALVVEDAELGRIEKAPGIQGVELDEVAPVFAAVGEIESAAGRSKGAVGGRDGAGGLGYALAGTGSRHDDEAGLSAVFSRRRAGDDFEGLNGIGGNLVGEGLALLIGDRLAVDGKGVGRVIAEPMEEAVGVGGDTRGGGGDERAERRRLALERHLDEQVTVNIGVKGGVIFDQVARGAGLHRNRLAGGGDLEDQFEGGGNHGVDFEALMQGCEPGCGDGEPIVVERDVGDFELAGRVRRHSSVQSADSV